MLLSDSMIAHHAVTSDAESRLRHLARLPGNTPMLAIECRHRGQRRVIKSEQSNMTGSIKDRMAFHILRQGHADGSLQPEFTVVEASSRNTGISMTAMGRAMGHE